MHMVSFSRGESIVFKECGDGKYIVGVMMLLSQTWVRLPTHSKTSILIVGRDEVK